MDTRNLYRNAESSAMSSGVQEGLARIPGTDFEKVPKLLARYLEFSEFKNADTSKGYFCAACIYFFEGKNECAIVQSTGESADGVNSDDIAPHGMCALWKHLPAI
jgi:hypothetical protein